MTRPPRRATVLFFVVLSAYCAGDLLVRLALSNGLEFDETEQVVLTQWLAAGYPTVASQPPLYTWLQRLLFDALGVGVFPVAALRVALQFLTQVFL